ncbi:LPS-assembly lipoprotein LptE [Marinobacterium arenosum]|uniref:LPS-assembly lipoprotein LptE n=1 Tax=Marinobacterium arenosum TaxID=2862496 RepID=UPI001C96C7EF|nr:LPS assembly lipoprotein LptE [Marinobacterium arenosum]MBY4676219.1 hypothetical protein [Marinobacterium arenosum]
MLRRTLLSATAALLLTGLSGCGFQLRGYIDVPEALRQVQLVQHGPHSQLASSLVSSLQLNQVQIVSQAPYRLELLSVVENRRSATLDSRAKVDEYELQLRVRFQVSQANGELALAPQQLTTERIYTYDADAATAALEQEQLLRQEMADDLALQITRRYLALKPVQ